MITSRLHLNVPIFFPRPHVVRLVHTDCSYTALLFRSLTLRIRETVTSTWGFSSPIYESARIVSHWCFADELDALQFILMADNAATRVHMWPKRSFVIHEFAESVA